MFQALFTLTDLHKILRETALQHELDKKQREQAERLFKNLERQFSSLKQVLLK